jgi:hypothetical protein
MQVWYFCFLREKKSSLRFLNRSLKIDHALEVGKEQEFEDTKTFPANYTQEPPSYSLP